MNSLFRKWGEQVIRSRQYASGLALVAAFFSFFSMPIIGWLSSIVIALVTLQNGLRAGLFVTAWAILPAVAMLCLGQYALFINVVLLHYLLVWSFAVILRHYGGWMNLLQLSALLGMVAVVLIHYLVPDLQSWLVSELSGIAKEFKPSVFNFRPADVDVGIKYLSLLATGILVLGTIVSNLMTLFLARLWQLSVNPAINSQKEWYALRMHYAASLLLIALAVGLSFNSGLFINLFIVALLPFVLAGLSLLHAYFVTKKNGGAILFVFYIAFLFLSPYIVLLLTLIGCLDSFINFRKKFVLESAIEE